MYNSRSNRYQQLRLVISLAITSLLTFGSDITFAEVRQDNTLGSENSVVTPKMINGQTVYQIEGGTLRGNNLFHSFAEFSVPSDSTAYFNNNTNIQNIISRVTGNSISTINGILKTNGTANLFLINPQGIIFGTNAALDIGGSFLASTASSVNFANHVQFSATNPQTVPLLAVDVPLGLQFGASAAEIRNQSQASLRGATNRIRNPAGLKVQTGKTLALIGGDLVLEGGNLTAPQGRIELGSVGANSLVSLDSTHPSWIVGYKNVQNWQNIQLTRRTVNASTIRSQVDVSGEGSGSIHLQGKQVLINGFSQLLANTLGSRQGESLTINASESVELVGRNTAILTTTTFGSGNAGDLRITTGKLIVRNVAQVQTGTQSTGLGGKLIINAADSVVLKDSVVLGNSVFPSGLFSSTSDKGEAGDIIINTRRLSIVGGAKLLAESSGRSSSLNPREYLPALGKGGNLTVNATDSVEIIGTLANNLISEVSTSTKGPGSAGNLKIITGQLIVRDGGVINVSSGVQKNTIYLGDPTKLGPAGELTIIANSVLLDTKGKLIAESEAGKGGNILLQLQDSLRMRRNSQISANAGKIQRQGDGGNITIDAPNGFIIAAPNENSDITANAFSGIGGKITINTHSILGFVPRARNDLVELLGTENPDELNPNRLPSSDITAFSQENPSFNGIIQIKTPDTDPNKGLVELPINLIDASEKIASRCNPNSSYQRSSFVSIGQGGIASSPTDTLIGDSVLVDWAVLPTDTENIAGSIQRQQTQQINSIDRPPEIIEAQGWIVDRQGNVVLVAQAPTVTPHSPVLNSSNCAALGKGSRGAGEQGKQRRTITMDY